MTHRAAAICYPTELLIEAFLPDSLTGIGTGWRFLPGVWATWIARYRREGGASYLRRCSTTSRWVEAAVAGDAVMPALAMFACCRVAISAAEEHNSEEDGAGIAAEPEGFPRA